VIPGSPGEAAGFDRGDVVVAVDGHAMDFDRFVRATDEHKPDDSLRVLVLRLGEVKEISVTLEPDPRPTYTLKPMDHPNDLQKAIYNSWLGIR
jgi:predicted metalloprotease with PDZ domain